MSTTTQIREYPALTPSTNGATVPSEVGTAAEAGAGWLVFASVLLVFAGILGIVYGIVAVANSTFFVAGAQFVFSGLHTWGWIVMGAGALTLLAGLAVTTGSELARWYGIVIAGLQAMSQILAIQAYPFWSLCVFALDVAVIYALAVYGGSRLRKRT